MKKAIIFLIISLIIVLNGCANTTKEANNVNIKNGDYPIEYSIKGSHSALYENYLVIEDEKGLKVVDLNTKKEIKSIPIPNGLVLGFDIWKDTVVWSDLRSESKESMKELNDIYKGNADVFIYNLKTDELKQITRNTSSQINPKIWENYIVYQDNSYLQLIHYPDKETEKNYPNQWSIRLYNINTGEEKQITKGAGSHTNPQIRDNKVVWEDGRNFKGEPELRGGENLPENNTDIYLYDIKTGEETPIATGKLKESKPSIYENYVVWEDRNNGSYNADIMLYDLSTKEKIQVTKDNFNQVNPRIYGDYIVWEDERRGGAANDVIVNGIEPNADIFMYNLKTKDEKLMTGDEVQIMPNISSQWVAFTLSRQVEPQIQVIKYIKNQTKDSPEEVIRTYFEALSEKNFESMQSTQTESRRGWNIDYGFDNLKYIKLISINEDTATISKEDYMERGRGSLLKPVDVRVFWVEWEQEVIDPKKEPNPSSVNGRHQYNFILIKMTKDSSWLIDDMGV